MATSGDTEEAALDRDQLLDDRLAPENPLRGEKSGPGGGVRLRRRRLPVPPDAAGPEEFVEKVVRALNRLEMENGLESNSRLWNHDKSK